MSVNCVEKNLDVPLKVFTISLPIHGSSSLAATECHDVNDNSSVMVRIKVRLQ